MNSSCQTPPEQLCGCCQGIGDETPQPVTNRPGLSSVQYRVSTQTAFKSTLLAGLSDANLPGLARLTTRDDADFSIALLDAWAVTLDILTFYQERLVNENYLGTAIDSRSVFELARLVGYQPAPGVAASALISFMLSDAPGSPEKVPIPTSTRVQSTPGPGETPQVFETANDLTAFTEHNALPAQRTIPWALNNGDTSIWLQGTANKLNPGDGLLFVSAALRSGVLANDTSASGAIDFHLITSVTLDSNAGTTFVTWDGGLNWPDENDNAVFIYVFRKKAGLFGAQAPDPRVMNNVATVSGYKDPNSDWDFIVIGSGAVQLDASYSGLAPVINGEPQWLVQRTPNLTAAYQITGAEETAPMRYTVTAKTSRLSVANEQVIARKPSKVRPLSDEVEVSAIPAMTAAKVMAFKLTTNPAIVDQLFEEPSITSIASDGDLTEFAGATREASVYIQPDLLTPADFPYIAWSFDGTYPRQAGVLKPVEGASLEIVGGQRLVQHQPAAVFGKRLRLQVNTGSSATFVPDKGTGGVAISDGQVFIVDAFPPSLQTQVRRIPRYRYPAPLLTSLMSSLRAKAVASTALLSSVSKSSLTSPVTPMTPALTRTGLTNLLDFAFTTQQVWKVETTDGVTGTLHVAVGDVLLLPADKSDVVVSEGAIISQLSVNGSITTLGLDQPLTRIYDRAMVTVNANVTEANHGETVHEILGSGDATNPALQFTLKQTPLTFISSATPSGCTSTLQVWVNNLEWHEVDNFLASGPSDRVFVTRMANSGKVTVQFGDGERGARPPTGQMNIRAVYRKGIGAAGMVRAGQLTQPLDRPQGLNTSTNPDPANGGADPDTADAARTSAPLHVLTLDRVVSLEDYENFARAFGGLSKALATWTWFGRTRGIFLTVAGAGGAVLKTDDPTLVNLVSSLRTSGNPFIPLQVASYIPVLFEVAAQLKIDLENYDKTLVLAAVWQALTGAFSFPERELGEGVAQSEIIAAIQSVPGVIAVSLTAFQRQGDDPVSPLSVVLRASAPVDAGSGIPQAAEMLLLDPASVGNLGVWS